MTRQRAFNLRKIAAEALKPPERTRSFARVRGNVSCVIFTSTSPWCFQASSSGWSVKEDAPDHVMTVKQLHAWTAERLLALANEQEMEP